MKNVHLPSFLKPEGSFDLERIGSDYDGGYLTDKRDMNEANILIGLGINNDWSFEKQFIKCKNIPLQAFDASVNFFQLFKLLFQSRFITKSLYSILSFKSFFSNERVLNKLFVGYDNIDENFISFNTVINDYSKNSNKIFVKIDIEGWEYRILDEIIKNQDKICGLIIEFHEVDLNMERIKSFVKKINLNIAHCHCNNYGPIASKGIPTVIELTFSSHKALSQGISLPHDLDQPNNPKNQEFEIIFKNNF